MKLRDYKPKNKYIELAAADKEFTYFKILVNDIIEFSKIPDKYLDQEVLSVKNYNCFYCTTSIVIEDNDFDCYMKVDMNALGGKKVIN